LDDYIDSPFNPRIKFKEGDFAFDSLSKSIEEFKFLQPIIVNRRTHHIISGHLRKQVLKAKGITKTEAVIVDFDETKEKAAVIAFNKISGSWDEDKLAVLLEELQNIPNLDVTLTGFNLPELSEILDNFHEIPDGDNFDFQSAVDSIKEPVTKKGDIIELGVHRLMCGDATNKEDLDTLLGENKVAILDIDWPYNVNYMGGSCPRVDTRPKKSRKWDKIYSDNLPQGEYEEFMRSVLTNIKPHLLPGAAFYQWQAHRQLGSLYQILEEFDFYVSCLICWAKESAAISYADYSFQTEQAVYGWLKNGSHYFAGKPGESNLWQVKRDPTKSYLHPCQKPVALAEHAIKNSSKRGDAVLDVFMGSGSVLIAAEALGRCCFGMELDPKFCDAVVLRHIAFGGEDKVSAEIKSKYLKEVH
jgi:DNA modification methylase